MVINGEKRTVVVDDYFPYDVYNEEWAFSRPKEVEYRPIEIWVLILEKVWAKIFGSYQRIEAGLAGEALNTLTGSPHTFYSHDDLKKPGDFFQEILRSANCNFPMCAAAASKANLGVS